MSNPVPGSTYIIQSRDTVSDIAARAYGNPAERTRIINANGLADPDKIIAGQSLVIPLIPGISVLTRQVSIQDDGFRLKIGNRVLPVLAGRVLRTMDTPADGWSAVVAWDPGLDKEFDKLTQPFQYPDASVYLDGQLMISGKLYNVRNKFSGAGRTKELEGFSSTIDIVDSHLFPPYQYQNMTLVDFCREMFKITGIGIVIDSDIANDVEGIFKEEKINQSETIFKFLERIADKKAALLSSTREGDLLITRANLKGATVGTIEEGKTAVETWEANFNGRKLFRTYRGVLKKKALGTNKTVVLTDVTVKTQRIRTFAINEGDEKDIERAVKWERNKRFAEAMSFSMPGNSWYAPDGKLWEENSRILVKSQTFEVPEGFMFIIRRVEFLFDDKGETAVLNIIPPSFYSKQEPVLPWVKKIVEINVEELKTEIKLRGTR